MIKIGKQGKEMSVGMLRKWAIILLVSEFVARMIVAILTGATLVSAINEMTFGLPFIFIIAILEDMEKKNESSKKQEGDVTYD